MTELSIPEGITRIVNDELKKQPRIQKGKITKKHDNNHADIKINNITLTYIETIGTPTVGHTGILIPLPDDEYIIIT